MCPPLLGALLPGLAGGAAAAGTAGLAAGVGAAGAGAATAAATAGAGFGSLGSILQIGGGLVGALGQMANARAMSQAASRSADAAQKAARESIEAGDQESDLARKRGARLFAQNQVAAAANGMDVNAGSTLDMLEDTKQGVAQDAFRIRTNAYREAEALSQQAANYRTESASAKSQSFFAPIQTILSTGSQVAGRYASWYAGQQYPGTSAAIMAGGY